MSERRRYTRVPVDIPAHGNIDLQAMLEDLSINGCFLRTLMTLPRDTVIDLAFSLPNDQRAIRVRAQVCWQGRYSSDRRMDSAFGVGVRFIRINLDDLVRIRDFVQGKSKKTRKHPRAKAAFKVRFGFDPRKLLHKGEARDISLGGLFVKTKNLVDLDDILHLEFKLPESGETIACSGKVVSINDSVPNIFEKMIEVGMGLEFRKITDEALEAIDAHVSGELNRQEK